MNTYYQFLNEKATEYTDFVREVLAKYNVSSPKELDDETKAKFYEELDKGWTSEEEKK